jgi:His/Glu/Gln/Arg/opine family amino acid ABC transporter permease subunit
VSDCILCTLDISVIWRFWPALATGLMTTLLITLTSYVCGIVCAVILAILSRSRRRIARVLVTSFVEVFRGTPLLVQAVWLHFALPMVTRFDTTPLESGIIALSLNTAAYATEIIRAGVAAVHLGQFEAAAALGLRRSVIWFKVVLPPAFRLMLPTLSNLLVSVTKGSALLSIIAVNDLLRITARVSAATFHPIELFTAAGIIYLAIGVIVAWTFRVIEMRVAIPR